MSFSGIAIKDSRTKDIVERLDSNSIAVINHSDMDRVSAESLAKTGVTCVLNAAESISGLYPNVGPKILLDKGIHLIDNLGLEFFDAVSEGEVLRVIDDEVYRGDELLAKGVELTENYVSQKMDKAQLSLDTRLDDFTRNTLSYLEYDRDVLLSDMWVPPTDVPIAGRHVLVVIRGYDYMEDLRTLHGYISETRPVFIGVDGGADALLEAGYKPDIIIGDMDSVSDEALLCGAQLIAHAYPDGSCPAMDRIKALGLSADPWALSATSEDLALLLAYHSLAELIVAVGTHANMIEYLDKGRGGMSSTFLVRLKVGDKLVDAKGVSKLYRTSAKPIHVIIVIVAALIVMIATFAISPALRDSLRLVWIGIQNSLG